MWRKYTERHTLSWIPDGKSRLMRWWEATDETAESSSSYLNAVANIVVWWVDSLIISSPSSWCCSAALSWCLDILSPQRLSSALTPNPLASFSSTMVRLRFLFIYLFILIIPPEIGLADSHDRWNVMSRCLDFSCAVTIRSDVRSNWTVRSSDVVVAWGLTSLTHGFPSHSRRYTLGWSVQSNIIRIFQCRCFMKDGWWCFRMIFSLTWDWTSDSHILWRCWKTAHFPIDLLPNSICLQVKYHRTCSYIQQPFSPDRSHTVTKRVISL